MQPSPPFPSLSLFLSRSLPVRSEPRRATRVAGDEPGQSRNASGRGGLQRSRGQKYLDHFRSCRCRPVEAPKCHRSWGLACAGAARSSRCKCRYVLWIPLSQRLSATFREHNRGASAFCLTRIKQHKAGTMPQRPAGPDYHC